MDGAHTRKRTTGLISVIQPSAHSTFTRQNKTNQNSPLGDGGMRNSFYTLQQLIIKKFGKEDITSSCYIVQQWMNFDRPHLRTWSELTINIMCGAESFEEFPLSAIEVEHLRRLFSLKHFRELFSFPELIPQQLQNDYAALPKNISSTQLKLHA
jgi:hypothetical protein